MKRLDRYRAGQLLRRIADRIDGGLHRAFMDAERAADVQDALQKAEDERGAVVVTPRLEFRPAGSAEDFHAYLMASARRGAAIHGCR